MSGHGQHQIHQRLEMRTVEVKNAVTKEKQAKCRDGADEAQYRGDP